MKRNTQVYGISFDPTGRVIEPLPSADEQNPATESRGQWRLPLALPPEAIRTSPQPLPGYILGGGDQDIA